MNRELGIRIKGTRREINYQGSGGELRGHGSETIMGIGDHSE